MVAAEPEEATGQLEHAKILDARLLPADQEAATTGELGQRALDHLTAVALALSIPQSDRAPL